MITEIVCNKYKAQKYEEELKRDGLEFLKDREDNRLSSFHVIVEDADDLDLVAALVKRVENTFRKE